MYIGIFKRTDEGIITGTIQTLTLNVEVDIFIANVDCKEWALHIVRTKDLVVIGWGRSKLTSEREVEYIDLTIDDPTFPAAFQAELKRCGPGEYDLIWRR